MAKAKTSSAVRKAQRAMQQRAHVGQMDKADSKHVRRKLQDVWTKRRSGSTNGLFKAQKPGAVTITKGGTV